MTAASRPNLGKLQKAILTLLTGKEMYGMEIQRRLRFQGFWTTAGQLYPALKRLEETGILESHEVPRVGVNRKYYSVTDRGKEALSQDLISQLWFIEYMFTVRMQPTFSELVDEAGIEQGFKVLDVSNYLLEDLRQAIAKMTQPNGLYTIICRESIVKLVREWVEEEQLSGVKVTQSEAGCLPYKKNSADRVLAFLKVHEEDEWLLPEIHRVLKPGGKALLMEIEAETGNIKTDLLSALFSSHHRTGVEIKQLFQNIQDLAFIVERESREKGVIKLILRKMS